MTTYTYLNGHINGVRPYFVMYNGQRYNAAYYNGHMVFGQVTIEEPITKYTPFFVENITDSIETLQIQKNNSSAPTLNIYCSTDMLNWSLLCRTSTTAFQENLYPGDRLYLRCNTTSWTSLSTFSSSGGKHLLHGFSKVGGNIMSLLYGTNFTGNETTFPTESEYNFYGLLQDGYDILTSAEDLILPATTLTPCCYKIMFTVCGALTSAPELPATTLADGCYNGMFEYCTSLETAPDLPASILFSDCYDNMFYHANNLKSIKCLATGLTSTTTRFTTNWLYNVPSGGTFYKKAGVTWPTGTSGIPTGWTVVEV